MNQPIENNKGANGMSIFASLSYNPQAPRGQKPGRMYELLREYGLWAVFFGTMIEGDLTLLLSGVLARAGLFSLGEALLVGTAGGFVGDSLSYLIGARFRGRAQSFHFFIRAKPRLQRLSNKLRWDNHRITPGQS